ncbi:hypothetical protein ACFLU6_16180 [Acidobacteriota bacterium]
MIELVKKLGLLVLLVGLGLLTYTEFIAKDQTAEQLVQFQRWTKSALILGCLIYIGGLALGILGRAKDKVVKSRCLRCGKPVRKGHIYCDDHQKEVIEDYRDRVEAETEVKKRRHPRTG